MAERAQTVGEEIANSVTHGVGAALSVAALVMLVVAASANGASQVVSAAVFGATLVLLYLSSTLYHALPGARVKRLFRVFDHSSIFLLIAGTYTPFTLVTLRGPWGWSLFAVVWGLAIAGTCVKSLFVERWGALSTGLYIGMGWCVVVAMRPLMAALPTGGLAWLVAGGVFYTAGVVFYAMQRRYAHMVWHLFVLAGSVCHFWAVYRYVLSA